MAAGRSRRRKTPRSAGNSQEMWIYGHHAVFAALRNSDRMAKRVLYVRDSLPEDEPFPSEVDIQPEIVTRDQIDGVLPPGAVHQGIAALMSPLPSIAVEDICTQAATLPNALIVVLDRVADPQNIGAIIRSAAVFGAIAVVIQDRNAPQITGVIAKAASGGIEQVPLVRVTNLSRAIETLKNSSFWCIGLDSEAPGDLQKVKPPSHTALVLGAEGAGLRRLVRENCDELVRIEGNGAIASLNVSNAAAVALYSLSRTPNS